MAVRLLKYLTVFLLIVVVVMYSLLISYMVDVTLNGSKSTKVLLERSESNYEMVVLNTFERSVKARNENDEYNVPNAVHSVQQYAAAEHDTKDDISKGNFVKVTYFNIHIQRKFNDESIEHFVVRVRKKAIRYRM